MPKLGHGSVFNGHFVMSFEDDDTHRLGERHVDKLNIMKIQIKGEAGLLMRTMLHFGHQGVGIVI